MMFFEVHAIKSMKIYFSITKCDIYVGVDMDFFPWSRLFKIFFFVPFYLFEINFLYVQLNRMSTITKLQPVLKE